MDRPIVYAAAIPQDLDILNTNKDAMIGLGIALQAIIGTTTIADGLPCTPTTPASMSVNVGAGSIYSQQNVDNSAYGSLAPDTADQIVKQGIALGITPFNCPAPATSGYSIAYLIEASYADVDSGSVVLPYYNSSNPAVPYNGPNNTGVSQNTVRKGSCVLTLKTGTAAPTNTQVLPSADVGAIPLYAITVANGQTTITSGNIIQLNSFITTKLPAMLSAIQAAAPIYAADTSGTANTIVIALTPSVSALTAGQPIRVKVANTNTSAVVINANGLGNISAALPNGAALPQGILQANGIYTFVYDGSHWQLQQQPARVLLTANTAFFVASTGNDSTGNGTSGAPWLTLQHAVNYVANNIDLAGFSVTINWGGGATTSPVNITQPWVGGNNVTLLGTATSGSPTASIITTTGANCITASGSGVSINVSGFQLATTTSGNALQASNGAIINVTGFMNYSAIAGGNSGHIVQTGEGAINVTANYLISGSAFAHWYSNFFGTINITSGLTITLSGTPNFTGNFATAENQSSIIAPSLTFSGAATGDRYQAGTLSEIYTNGGGSTYLPGNAANSSPTVNGGQYV